MNKKMTILKALGIILVVGGHSGSNFFNWFPVYSFHMPLFIFISGYFFHETGLFEGIKRKIKTLLVPYFAWNLFYGSLVTFFLSAGIIKFGTKLSLVSYFWRPFTDGHQYVFNCPAWFVPTLFLVCILYNMLDKTFRSKHTFIGGVTLALYFIAMHMSYNGYRSFYYGTGLMVEKAFFMVIFYHLGYMYRLYIEPKDNFSFNRLMLAALANGFILTFISKKITFGVWNMGFPNHKILLPLVVSCTGIYLFLQIAELLKDKIKDSDLLSYIGNHTFAIMMHHLTFFWLLNTILFLIKKYGLHTVNSFNNVKYMTNVYYRIGSLKPFSDTIYMLVGVFGPIVCCYVYEKYLEKHVRNFLGRVMPKSLNLLR